MGLRRVRLRLLAKSLERFARQAFTVERDIDAALLELLASHAQAPVAYLYHLLDDDSGAQLQLAAVSPAVSHRCDRLFGVCVALPAAAAWAD